MATRNEPPQPEPPPQPPPADEPEWARSLRESIESLPGKLRASISDDDRRSIAEHVHGLFERSGAFEKPETDPEPPKDEPAPQPPPEPAPQRDSIARRLFGHH